MLPVPDASTPRIVLAAAAFSALINPTIGIDLTPVPPDSTGKVPLILEDKSIFLSTNLKSLGE